MTIECLWRKKGDPFFYRKLLEETDRLPTHGLCLLTFEGKARFFRFIKTLPLYCFDDVTRQTQKMPSLKEISETPSFSQWEKQVESFKKEKTLQKVVLARRKSFIYSEAIDTSLLLYRLMRASLDTYAYALIFPQEEKIFMGLSPETLFMRRGDLCETEAIAGTSKDVDKESLWHSQKDQKEQDYVATFIEKALAPLSQSCLQGPKEIFSLPLLNHLKTPFTATLKKGVTDLDLLNALHPTPAVGGYPQKEAISFIRKTEKFDRGLYAGVLGVIEPTESSWCVLIRSLLFDGPQKSIELTAGAGIVDTSNALYEWKEIDLKLKTLTSTLLS